MNPQKPPRRKQSIGEEIANATSHGIGSLLAIAGTVVLIVYAAVTSDALAVVSAALYGATLIILYTNSTLYHSLTHEKAKKVFRVFDHCSIFMLILGTYIPVSLSLMRNWVGWLLFSVNITCAVLGIVFKSVHLERFKKVCMVLYLVMGWSVILTAYPVIRAILDVQVLGLENGLLGIILLAGGGVFYTVGLAFFGSKRKFMHFIWHFFVLFGSICHYIFVMLYCIPPAALRN